PPRTFSRPQNEPQPSMDRRQSRPSAIRQSCGGYMKIIDAAARALLLAALTSGATTASAATAPVVVTQDLGSARPREVIAIPFTQVAAVIPDARMYHLVVRDSK